MGIEYGCCWLGLETVSESKGKVVNILVLGSAGQIGSHFVEYVRTQMTYDVTTFDIEDDPVQDLRIRSVALEQAVANCDLVMFLAFDVGGSPYLLQYQHTFKFIDNNATMLANVFGLVHKYEFGLVHKYEKPVIFVSSQMATMSWSPYGALKSLGEIYAKSMGGVVVKFWNVYGREHDHKKFHVISDFITMAIREGRIRMRTDGLEERQFLQADDCSGALLYLTANYATLDREKEYHITSHEWTTIRKIADIIANKLDVEVQPGEKTDTVQGVKNEADDYMLNF